VHLRDYRPEDAADLVALFRASVHELARADYTPQRLDAWAPAQLDAERFGARWVRALTWVAELDGAAAGFASLEYDGHVDMLYVHPTKARRGVARALLEHLERTARALPLERLYTEASITARPLFEAQGFRLLAPQTVVVNGQGMRNYRMDKALAH
jgi:putative acetyltransferase